MFAAIVPPSPFGSSSARVVCQTAGDATRRHNTQSTIRILPRSTLLALTIVASLLHSLLIFLTTGAVQSLRALTRRYLHHFGAEGLAARLYCSSSTPEVDATFASAPPSRSHFLAIAPLLLLCLLTLGLASLLCEKFPCSPRHTLSFSLPLPSSSGQLVHTISSSLRWFIAMVQEQDNTWTASWPEFWADRRIGDLVRRSGDAELVKLETQLRKK